MNQNVAGLCIIPGAGSWQFHAGLRQTLRRKYETFAQGVTVVGRSGRYVCICCCSEASNPLGADAVVSSQSSAVQRVVARFTELLSKMT